MIGGAWSMGGRVSPHINLGYDFWSDGIGRDPEIKNQAMYAAGAEVQVTPKMTAVLDLVGRRLFGAGGHYYASLPGPVSMEVLASTGAALNVVSLAPGIKWNPIGNGLLVANVLVSLANGGVRAKFIPVIGMDWTF